MKRQIVIHNIKNIRKLVFDIPSKGVKLLTGTNGVGKTTLLVCLARIGQPWAYRENFKIPKAGIKVDNFNRAKIIYKFDDDQIVFKKRAKNWSRTHNEKSGLLECFGYSSVLYIKANGERLQPTEKELTNSVRTPVDPSLVHSIIEVLENDKFEKLKAIKVDRGRGKKILLLEEELKKFRVGKQKVRVYRTYSEKNFSLGEICIIRILQAVNDCMNNSFILIDEIEMSLHPRVQYNLLNYLKDIAKRKDLTVILSTHSVTMIKCVSKKDIILLYDPENNGMIQCLNPCYPAVALNNIAYEEDIELDYIFLVEDEEAKLLLLELLNRYWEITPTDSKPIYRIIPIGGYANVVYFLQDNKKQLFANTSMYAFLDQDVKKTIKDIRKKKSKKNGEVLLLKKIEDQKRYINYLPITPETGLIKMLNDSDHVMRIEESLQSTANLKRVFQSNDYIAYSNNRAGDKKRLDCIVTTLTQNTGRDEKYIRNKLYRYFVNKMEQKDILELLGPILNH